MFRTFIPCAAALIVGAIAVAAGQPALAQKNTPKQNSASGKQCHDVPITSTICWHNYSKQMTECKQVTKMARVCSL